MFPSDCVLDRRVRSDAHHHQDLELAATDLPLFILRCEDRKADGFAGDKLELYNQRLKDMVIGVRLADAPPAVSYLVVLGAWLSAEIVAVDNTVIVINLGFTCEGGRPRSYLIYDAVALSLRMIPEPKDPSWVYSLSSRVSVARPCHGPDYALVHTGQLVAGGEKSLFLWRPCSSSSPWSQYKKVGRMKLNAWSETTAPFSFNGHTYWVDLLRGLICFSCDALFGSKSSSMLKFIRLPVEPRVFDQRFAVPAAYRTMGIIRGSFIRFVSIDGFQDYVKLKKRTVTVWKLGQDKGWEMEHEFSLETLWGFEGFGEVPKTLTPMYPLLSTKDIDVVYLGLGNYRETKIVRGSLPPEREFLPYYPLYMLTIDMRNKIIRTSLPLEGKKVPRLVSCGFSRYLRKALVGPCDDEGVPIPMKKKRDGGNVAEAPFPMKKTRRKEEA